MQNPCPLWLRPSGGIHATVQTSAGLLEKHYALLVCLANETAVDPVAACGGAHAWTGDGRRQEFVTRCGSWVHHKTASVRASCTSLAYTNRMLAPSTTPLSTLCTLPQAARFC